jgi:hypothetical protein
MATAIRAEIALQEIDYLPAMQEGSCNSKGANDKRQKFSLEVRHML